MKRNIFIRILCLLLCISMLLPFGAAATVLEEISVDGWGNDGLTTNEMAYVDQFYKGSAEKYGSSYLSSEGYALKRWLSNESQGGRNRVDSGYLMLDEEVSKNSSKKLGANGDLEKNDGSGWHMFKEFNARFLGPVADYFASGGASIAIALIEEGAFRLKFKWAGKSAYPYYAQLCQVYYEYVANLQNELNEVDNTLGNIGKEIESAAKIAPDTIRITTEEEILILSGTGEGEGLVYRPTEVDFDNQIMTVEPIGGGKPQSVAFSKLDKNVSGNNEYIAYVMTGMDPKVRKKLVNELNKNAQLDNGEDVLRGMSYQYFTDTSENAGELHGMKKRVKQMRDLEPAEKKIDISEELKDVEAIGKQLSAVNSTIQAFNATANVTIQQKCYMNALTSMSQHYLDMLCQWYEDVESYDVPFGYGDVKRDIQDAIKALVKDVLDLQADASKKLTKSLGNAFIYNSGTYASAILDIAEAAGWGGISDWIKLGGDDAKNSSKLTSRLTGAAAIFSIGWNLLSSKFLEFEDTADTIYNLKWSLDELLTNEENGLLLQYAQNRNHETACEIIRALDTMKILKLMGENLIEEYYLCDFYDSLGVDVSSAAHLVLRNEMAKRTSDERLDASDSFTPIIGVYRDFVREFSVLEMYAHSAGGTQLAMTGEVYRRFLGYYVADKSTTAIFDGKKLDVIPSHYKNISNKVPQYHGLYYEYSDQMTQDLLAKDPDYEFTSKVLYQNDQLKLYSINGIDVILTGEDYNQYMKLEKEINRLIDTYGDNSTIDWRQWEQEDHSRKEEKQVEKEKNLQERLQWTITTRGWIETIDMYDPGIDYIALKKNGYK